MIKKFKPYFKATIKKTDEVSSMFWDAGEEERVKLWLGSLQYKKADTKIKVTLERYRNDASTRQKRYLFGVVYPIIGEYVGVDAYEYDKEIHTPLKIKFLGLREMKTPLAYPNLKISLELPYGQILEPVSLTDLNTKEMTDFIDKVRRWALVEHNLIIPAPNEVDYEDLPDVIPNF